MKREQLEYVKFWKNKTMKILVGFLRKSFVAHLTRQKASILSEYGNIHLKWISEKIPKCIPHKQRVSLENE